MSNTNDLHGEDGPVKRTANKGRRAKPQSPVPWSMTEINDSIAEVSTQDKDSGSKKPAELRRKRGVWSDAKEVEDSRFQLTESDEEDMPVIPTLDENNDEIQEDDIAAPPSYIRSNILDFNDLNDDLIDHTSVQTLDGDIDMKIVAKNLLPPSEICEEDKPWNFDELFSEVRPRKSHTRT